MGYEESRKGGPSASPPPTQRSAQSEGEPQGYTVQWTEFRCPVNLTALPWGPHGLRRGRKHVLGELCGCRFCTVESLFIQGMGPI